MVNEHFLKHQSQRASSDLMDKVQAIRISFICDSDCNDSGTTYNEDISSILEELRKHLSHE